MRPLRPDTFLFTLPDGETKVPCWTREADAIKADVHRTGTVLLRRSSSDPEVFERVAQDSREADDVRARGVQLGG